MDFLNQNSSEIAPLPRNYGSMAIHPSQISPNGLALPLEGLPPVAQPMLTTGLQETSLTVTTTQIGALPATTLNSPKPAEGVFFVGSTGEIEVSFLADSGLYHSQVAFFSLTGMEKLAVGSDNYIKTAITRALSNSQQGRLVIDDFTEGAKLQTPLGEINFNDGVYRGVKKFSFKPGDQLGMLMIANGKLTDALGDFIKNRPLFSIAEANLQQAKQFGQLRSNVFGWEDVAGGGDRDFNDLVLSVGKVSGVATKALTLMAPGTSWFNLTTARSLFVEPASLVFDTIAEFKDSKYGLNIGFWPSLTVPLQHDQSWNQAIAKFDVEAFVADVAQTGAAYVIFSVGQTSGYYTSPNQTYLNFTGTQPGQFVPTRDLVKEVAQSLKKIGVATMVYLASEGPTAAPINIRHGLSVDNDRAEEPKFRLKFNKMVQEWSQRWGNDIAGWWLDGAWVNGYSNGVNGRSNLNALIRAAKSGNPESLVAVNPGSGHYTSLTNQQDFLAGETTVFDRFPDAVKTGAAWHTMSYLGTTWSEPSAKRYNNQQLINYVRKVNQGQGVVTMDVAINAKGRISKAQLAQLVAVKTAIRPIE